MISNLKEENAQLKATVNIYEASIDESNKTRDEMSIKLEKSTHRYELVRGKKQ